jgi:hypothetical protein
MDTIAEAPPSERFEIAGRTVTLPVRIRHARQWSASWLVPAAAAQAVIDHSGLEVSQPVPGKAMVAFAFVDYLDGDLDTYHEVAVSVVVRRHDAAPGATFRDHLRELGRNEVAAFILDLPVDQSFTCEAGNVIWGYPKWIADIELTELRGRTACTLRSDAGHQLTLDVPDGGPLPMPSRMPPTYSWRDGVLRRTDWEVTTEGGGARPGGARLTIGPRGPMAETLRRLQIPRRPVMSSATPHLTATFGPAEVVTVGR